MQIAQREVKGVIVLDLAGRFVLEDGVPEFVDLMNALARDGRKRILLNFEQVTYLDSAGVGAIAWKYVTALKRDGFIKLLNLHPKTHTVLKTTKLLTVIPSFDSEDAAIASFGEQEDEDYNPIYS